MENPLLSARLDRRALLRRGAALMSIGMTPAMLAACGGDEGSGTTAAPAGTSTQTPTVPPASGTIDFLSWEGYDIPDPMADWKQTNGVDVKSTYIGSHDDIQAKLGASDAGGYDLITYYQGYKPLYAELDIIGPIDENKIPNLKNLFPFFAGDEGNFWVDADGTRTGVPWTWGSLGITYDKAVFPEPPESYDVLFDPKYKGKVAVPDDPTGSYALASRLLGYDPSTLTEDQFQEVTDYLRRVIAQTNGVSPSFGDVSTRLVSGDAVLAWQGWSYVNETARAAGKDTIDTIVPPEGGFSFCDCWAIPPTSDNADTVHAWINETLDPERNAAIAEFLVGAVTVDGAVEFLKPNIAALYPYEELDALLERAPFFNNAPVESDEYVTIDRVIQQFQELKATA